MGNPRLVLASNSPRRRELLALGGWKFESRSPEVDESQHPGEEAGGYVLRLAESKARACAQPPNLGRLLLVPIPPWWMGTACWASRGRRLRRWKCSESYGGAPTRSIPGCVVISVPDGNTGRDLCVTQVPMRNYMTTRKSMPTWPAGDPLDKAGAYAIQHPRFHPVEDYFRLLCQRDGAPALPPHPQPAPFRHCASHRYCQRMPVLVELCLPDLRPGFRRGADRLN